jgi:hypothetical protein
VSITLGSLDVTDLTTNGTLFEFRRGTPADLSEYDGQDDTVPEASGMYAGVWTPRRRQLSLYGVVIGTGSTVADQQSSFRTRMAALVAVMNPSSTITISTTGEFGAASATLTSCRPMRMIADFEFASIYWSGVLELTCIKSPPTWAVTP